MEWADARAKLRERLQGGVDAGLPCVYVVSYDQADPPTKVGMVSYGQLNHRMGSFRTWARSFYLHALLYTETARKRHGNGTDRAPRCRGRRIG